LPLEKLVFIVPGEINAKTEESCHSERKRGIFINRFAEDPPLALGMTKKSPSALWVFA
jgi:hypothetical protein